MLQVREDEGEVALKIQDVQHRLSLANAERIGLEERMCDASTDVAQCEEQEELLRDKLRGIHAQEDSVGAAITQKEMEVDGAKFSLEEAILMYRARKELLAESTRACVP